MTCGRTPWTALAALLVFALQIRRRRPEEEEEDPELIIGHQFCLCEAALNSALFNSLKTTFLIFNFNLFRVNSLVDIFFSLLM